MITVNDYWFDRSSMSWTMHQTYDRVDYWWSVDQIAAYLAAFDFTHTSGKLGSGQARLQQLERLAEIDNNTRALKKLAKVKLQLVLTDWHRKSIKLD